MRTEAYEQQTERVNDERITRRIRTFDPMEQALVTALIRQRLGFFLISAVQAARLF
jgi:type II secretory pathway predicted ATPase ExeA